MSDDGIQRDSARAGCFRSTAATHVGTVRKSNQDGFVNRPDLGLWAVADGAGGHQAGELASRLVVAALESIPPELPADVLLAEVRLRLERAHEALRHEAARRGPETLIATTIVVLMARDGHFVCLWAGDTRAYLLRGDTLLQVTRDHSLVQELVDSGVITEEAASTHRHANVVTRAIGAETEKLSLDKRSGRLLPGDRLLLCSDGVAKVLTGADIKALLGTGEEPEADRLIVAALAGHARDNVTAVAVWIDQPSVSR